MALFQTQNLWVQEQAEGVAALVFDAPGKTNLLDGIVLEEIEKALTFIEADQRFQLCILRSKKGGSFCHGVAPATWHRLNSAEDWNAFVALGQRVCKRLAELRVPTVAVLGGPCLAGGLELALACDWRVALDQPNTLLGFTELDHGLIPGWGAIGRLSRLIALERCLQMLLGGKKLSAREALRWGLVDDLADVDSDEPPAALHRVRKRDAGVPPRRSWRQRLLDATAWGRRLTLRGAERVLRRRLPDDMPAPWAALDVVRTVSSHGAEAGMEKARAEIVRLGQTTACRNLLRLHVLHDEHRSAAASAFRPKKIGILGATPLGLHLTAQSAGKGREVALRVNDALALGMAALQIAKVLEEDVRRGAVSVAQYQQNVGRVHPTLTWKGFAEVEIVVDATPGSLTAKQALYREVEEHVPADAALVPAQPWSALAELEPGLLHPERLLGLHFPLPAGRTPLVEVLFAKATSATVIERVRGHFAALGKTSVVSRDAAGGLVQRVLYTGFGEALRLLEEGLRPERIEQAMSRFGMAYGPLEHLDWLGIDEFAVLAHRLEPVLGDRLAAHAVVGHMLKQRWLGVKTGLGFYQHASGKKSVNRALERWLRRYAVNTAPLSIAEQKKVVQDRMVGRMVNEAYRCLEEHVVASADEIDLALMLVGWAPHRGGPCRYVRDQGREAIVTLLEDLAVRYGERFRPSAALMSAGK